MRIPYDEPVAVGDYIELRSEVVAAILRTLQGGWMYVSCCRDVHAGTLEVAITERLRDGMRHVLKTGGHPWAKSMIVLPGSESRSRREVLVPDGRTDIPIMVIEVFLRNGEHDPHAVIECKRVAGMNSHLCREYVVEGIDRFQTGKYGRAHVSGFMAGYLLVPDAGAAVVGINGYLDRQQRDAEDLGPSDVLVEDWAWRSRHPRGGARPIELHHAFFELGPAPG